MPDIGKARDLLESLCRQVRDEARGAPETQYVSDRGLREAVKRIVNSRTKSFRYVFPTQLIAKAVDPALDCRSLQAGSGRSRAFDGRSVASKVVVPFDAANHRVLGGSTDPYVNNPLRVGMVSRTHEGSVRDKQGWRDLCHVLGTVERRHKAEFTTCVLKQVLLEILHRLEATRIEYPVPRRVSLDNTVRLIQDFLSVRSGGDREQAVASALFEVLGRHFGIYEQVRRRTTTAPDTATGQVADIECLHSGRVVLAVEVKDQALTSAHIDETLGKARRAKVAEILFLAQRGICPTDEEGLPEKRRREFELGHNVYIFDLESLARVVLAIAGETARTVFLETVGRHLDLYRSPLEHRRAWHDLLRSL